ncbi:MAG: hypothetical protein JO022_21085, partial [Acidobacteriaceae bacterium]|nr:hypothetical protein [Acidobacteriaceae bacterium]
SLDYADVVPGVPITLSGDRAKKDKINQYFNTAAFQKNAPGTFGNAGRNILRSPGFTNVDFGAVKQFPVRERWNVQFRSEFFNLFNVAHFLPPGNNLGAADFGKLTSARDPRILQFSLKVNF